MEKVKIAICMKENEYKKRFVKCVMGHYKESYEIYVIDEIAHALKESKFDLILTDDEQNIHMVAQTDQMLLLLLEQEYAIDGGLEDFVFCTEKYQEVYKIMDKAKEVTEKKREFCIPQKRDASTQLIGVFSLERESLQFPFSVLLAEILGETKRVLIADIQPFSGMSVELEVADVLGMEDMISIATTENYTISRLNGSIGHEQKWDFIYPVKNSSCLAESNEKLYQKMFQILEKEKGYECIIVNFGTIFSGMSNLMSACTSVYFLSKKGKVHTPREETFLSELKNQGKERLIQKLIWIELQEAWTRGNTAKDMAKEWLWGELGDYVRKRNWVEKEDG